MPGVHGFRLFGLKIKLPFICPEFAWKSNGIKRVFSPNRLCYNKDAWHAFLERERLTHRTDSQRLFKKGEMPMKEMIAYCGLTCTQCPSFLATLHDDDQARQKTAEYYAKRFGLTLKKEDINCDGCLTETGRLLGYCASCAIRKCCLERALENCAMCPDLPCGRLIEFHRLSPEAKAGFERVSKRIAIT
jgi:hypothetical protein